MELFFQKVEMGIFLWNGGSNIFALCSWKRAWDFFAKWCRWGSKRSPAEQASSSGVSFSSGTNFIHNLAVVHNLFVMFPLVMILEQEIQYLLKFPTIEIFIYLKIYLNHWWGLIFILIWATFIQFQYTYPPQNDRPCSLS